MTGEIRVPKTILYAGERLLAMKREGTAPADVLAYLRGRAEELLDAEPMTVTKRKTAAPRSIGDRDAMLRRTAVCLMSCRGHAPCIIRSTRSPHLQGSRRWHRSRGICDIPKMRRTVPRFSNGRWIFLLPFLRGERPFSYTEIHPDTLGGAIAETLHYPEGLFPGEGYLAAAVPYQQPHMLHGLVPCL